MLEDDYASLRSAVDNFAKDLGIVLDIGKTHRFPLPIAATAHQQFLAAAAAGLGALDDAAVVKVYERLAGVDIAAAIRSADASSPVVFARWGVSPTDPLSTHMRQENSCSHFDDEFDVLAGGLPLR
jgi:hypothetical protein